MDKILIRKCEKEDQDAILNICYRTGYMGEEMKYTNKFNDVKLFGYLFCFYYVWYETENCFVAIDEESNKAVGYILGTLDSKKQERTFKIKMIYRIVGRLLFSTLWNHNESFSMVMHFIKSLDLKDEPKDLYEKYPAHLHINILPEYQHLGIGSKLIDIFESHVKNNKINGVHLRTSNKNIKAVPFYERKGYKVIYVNDSELWKGVSGLKNLIYVKKMM